MGGYLEAMVKEGGERGCLGGLERWPLREGTGCCFGERV